MQIKYKTASVLLAATVVSGCAAPIGLQIASWTMSGISYATTGKSLSDHAISAVMESDCAVHRILLDGRLCVSADAVAVDTVLAEAEVSPPTVPSATATATAAIVAEIEQDLLARSVALTAGEPEQVGLFAVAGSFQERENANIVRRRYDDAAIAQAEVKGAHYFRVVVGPLQQPQWPAAARELERGGAKDVWPVRLCATSLTPPPCTTDSTILARALLGNIDEVL